MPKLKRLVVNLPHEIATRCIKSIKADITRRAGTVPTATQAVLIALGIGEKVAKSGAMVLTREQIEQEIDRHQEKWCEGAADAIKEIVEVLTGEVLSIDKRGRTYKFSVKAPNGEKATVILPMVPVSIAATESEYQLN